MTLASLKEQDKRDELEQPWSDGKDHLRADLLGSIAGSNPNDPKYLGRIDNVLTGFGALEKPSQPPPLEPGSRGYEISVGGTSQPKMRPPVTTMAEPPNLDKTPNAMMGRPTLGPDTPPDSDPNALIPTMGAKPKPGILGRIGHIASRMGNIAGDVLAPGVLMNIPGTDLNKKFEANVAEKRAERQQELTTRQTTAEAEKERADTGAKLEPSEEDKNLAEAFKARLAPEAKTDFEAWQRQNPNAPVSDWLKLLAQNKPPSAEQDTARATQLRADQAAGKTLSDADAAWLKGHTQEKTIVPAATVQLNQPKVANERADKSFQYNSTSLDKVSTPVEQAQARMGRLADAIAQNTPQADALIAPELLSVMAGGAGSGLRMNEAEINRIVGGRSNWESLKAAVNKWSLDPKEALSITPEQRREIRALTTEVQKKLTAKQQIIDDARNALIDSDDPKEHRRIVADAKKALDKIDAGEGGGSSAPPTKPKGVPDNAVWNQEARQWQLPKK